MTQTELDAIPELSTEFSQREVVIDGKKVWVPVAPDLRVLWQTDDMPTAVVDSKGVCWIVGYLDGRLVRRKAI